MDRDKLNITYIGGPTAILEWGGMRLLTDPTFDPPGVSYPTGLTKTIGPAIPPSAVGHIDVILLSHDHHVDNLDNAGRELLPAATVVATTQAGAARLGGNAVGLEHWQTVEVSGSAGQVLRITATPARHGPADGDRGPVIGFVLTFSDTTDHSVYFAGDTVWYEGVAEVARRFAVDVAVLNMGAASVPAVGPYHLTMNTADGIETARAFPSAIIVPLHFEGWKHFSESRQQIEAAFVVAGVDERVRWPDAGQPVSIPIGAS